MEKVKVNNQIVLMRKFVKQAKVHNINKLVKDAKNLKLKKGTDAQLEKNLRKSEKLLAEIEIMKKLPVDTLCKRALSKEKDWSAVLLDKSSTVEDRAFALVANFGAVQDEVKKFHNKESHLASILPDLLLQWEQKKRDPSEKHFKGLKASEFRKQKKDRLKKENPKFTKTKTLLPVRKKEKVEEEQQNSSIDNEDVADGDIPSEPHNSSFSAGEEDKQDDTVHINETDGDTKANNEDVPSVVPPQKKRKEMAVTVLDLNQLNDDESIPLGSASDNDSNSSGDEAGTVRVKNDPFFGEIDKEAEENVRRLEKLNPSSGRSSRGFGHGFRRGGKFNRNGPSRPFLNKGRGQFRGDQSFRPDRKTFNRDAPTRGGKRFQQGGQQFRDRSQKPQEGGFKPKSFSKGFMNKRNEGSPSKQNTPKIGGPLHPSWEAKRKLKMQCKIVKSEAKKIKFDD